MRTLIFLVFLCGNVCIGKAQQNYFVYLQTDNKQPFYVRVNEKVFSSSASGYVVIPKLQNGTHVFSVGFPKNEWPQQVIPVPVVNKDQGFILKNFDNKGWGLFNMQTLDVVMSNSNLANSTTAATTTTRTDEFSNTLAEVVNTPSIKEISKEQPKVKDIPKPVEPTLPVAETPKADPAPAGTIRDSTMLNTPPTTPTINSGAINDSVKSNAAVANGSIKKMSESATTEALYMSYLVQEGSSQDTIEVIIPVDAIIVPAPVVVEPAAIKDSAVDVTLPGKKETSADGKTPKFIDIELANPNASKDTVTVATKEQATQDQPQVQPAAKLVEAPAQEQVTTLKMINSDCKSSAGEADFLKTRKKMIAQKSEDQMINAAQKLFRQKCYSTEQVKNLSTLLLLQENKYKFFDMAYPFVYDTTNFKDLEFQLTDPYFLSRFRAMIRK